MDNLNSWLGKEIGLDLTGSVLGDRFMRNFSLGVCV